MWDWCEPKHFTVMSAIPTDSITARTAAAAMIPWPGSAGFISTEPAPKRPMISWGIEVPSKRTRCICLEASATPLRIASVTSLALPSPSPPLPEPSPTTTNALKLKRRPLLNNLGNAIDLDHAFDQFTFVSSLTQSSFLYKESEVEAFATSSFSRPRP